MNNLDRIKSLRAQDYGVAGLSTTDVDWLIAEVGRLTADRDRYKAWHDDVASRHIHVLRVYDITVHRDL